MPTKYNEIKDSTFSKRFCDSGMEAIAPDLTVYQCTGKMLRKYDGVGADDYDFKNSVKECNYYGLCGPCLTQKDVVNI